MPGEGAKHAAGPKPASKLGSGGSDSPCRPKSGVPGVPSHSTVAFLQLVKFTTLYTF